ncbi:MAG: hypothetical protein NC080_04070 [Paraprevotella sp.]|nr:hypothetical protein [Paraprevotella sp.]
MRKRRFQNNVSKSSLTLPLCMVLGTLVWFGNIASHDLQCGSESFATLFSAAATTYIVMETANKFALLRIRSNMVAAVWVTGIALMPFLHHWSAGWMAVPALAGCHYVMFHTYQDANSSVVPVFHTFALLGIASLSIPQMLAFVPLFYWYLLVFMRCMSWRSLWAGIVGLILPLCFVLGWSIVTDDYTFLSGRWDSLLSTRLFADKDYALFLDYRSPRTLFMAFITLLSLTGIVHYLRNYYNDKIRTRMYLYIYIIQTTVCWLMIMCMPSRFDLLAPSLMLYASTMVAHFFALTGTWVSNAFFCLTLLASAALTLVNLGLWKY